MMIIHPTALAGIDSDQRSVCGCAPVPEPFDRSPQSAQPDLVRPWSYATRTTRRAFANCSPLCASNMASPSTVRPAAAPPRHEETADRAGVNWKTSIRRIDLMLPLRQLSPAAHPPSLCASHSGAAAAAAAAPSFPELLHLGRADCAQRVQVSVLVLAQGGCSGHRQVGRRPAQGRTKVCAFLLSDLLCPVIFALLLLLRSFSE